MGGEHFMFSVGCIFEWENGLCLLRLSSDKIKLVQKSEYLFTVELYKGLLGGYTLGKLPWDCK